MRARDGLSWSLEGPPGTVVAYTEARMADPGAVLGLALESWRFTLEPRRLRLSFEPRPLCLEPWRLSLEPRKLCRKAWRLTLVPWRFILTLWRLNVKLWRLNMEPWHIGGSLVYFWGSPITFYHMSALYIHSRCNWLYIYNMDIQYKHSLLKYLHRSPWPRACPSISVLENSSPMLFPINWCFSFLVL